MTFIYTFHYCCLLTVVAEAKLSDLLRVCALLPLLHDSVSFTCINLSLFPPRHPFFGGQEPSTVDVKHTKHDRGRTIRSSSTMELSGVRQGCSAAHAARPDPVQGEHWSLPTERPTYHKRQSGGDGGNPPNKRVGTTAPHQVAQPIL